jgi:DnaJ-class molecular chaperone
MQSAAHFIESYLRDREEWQKLSFEQRQPERERYCSDRLIKYYEGLRRNFEENPEEVTDTCSADGVAKIITTRMINGKALRQRFVLKVEGDDWKIQSIERECFLCQGMGQTNNVPCSRCNGTGWKDIISDTLPG